jgi:SAM-dependent methyltransferase
MGGDILRLQLPPRGALLGNNAVDPLRFYYLPLLGRLFTARIDAGLGLLPPDTRFSRLLEVGYGSGLLLPTLARISDELYGVDLEAAPPDLCALLDRIGVRPRELTRGDLQALPFADGKFDGVVAFSILEHLRPRELSCAASELARVIAPGGRLLIGCPAVHAFMNLAFAAIGFRGIEQHHFSDVGAILAALERDFAVEKTATMPRLMSHAPRGWAPYTAALLRRRA